MDRPRNWYDMSHDAQQEWTCAAQRSQDEVRRAKRRLDEQQRDAEIATRRRENEMAEWRAELGDLSAELHEAHATIEELDTALAGVLALLAERVDTIEDARLAAAYGALRRARGEA